MKKSFLTNEETLFLEENLDILLKLFKSAHQEMIDEFYNDYFLQKNRDYTLYSSTFLNSTEFAFSNGYCFYFARLLKTVLPHYKFIIKFSEIDRDLRVHILLKHESKEGYFDVSYGHKIYNCPKGLYKDTDNYDLWYAKKCFGKLDKEIYEKLKYKFYRNIKEFLNAKHNDNKAIKIKR